MAKFIDGFEKLIKTPSKQTDIDRDREIAKMKRVLKREQQKMLIKYTDKLE